jgi:hypothetical protein
MSRNKAITTSICGIAIVTLLRLAASGQSTSALAANSLPAVLDGGSTGVPSNLHGTLSVSANRLVFEAFPDVENITMTCGTIKSAKFTRWNTHVLKVVSADTTYRFDLLGQPQAGRIMMALLSTCESLARH